MKIIAPVRDWQMGREEEIAYAREHGIPVKGGTEAPPYSIDDNIWGRSSEGGPIEDLAEPPRDDVFELVADARDAPDEPQDLRVEFERGVPVALDGERLGLVELIERCAEAGAPARGGRRGPHRGPDRRPQGARPLRGARGGDPAHRPPRAGEAGGHDPPEPLQARRSTSSGPSSSTPGSGTSRCRRTSNAYMDSVNEQVTGEIMMRLYKGRADRRGAQLARTRSTTRRSRASASPAGSSPSRRAPASSSSGACSRGWLTQSGSGERESHELKELLILGWLVWQIGSRVAKRKMAQNRVQARRGGVVALVVVGGILAARAGSDDDSGRPGALPAPALPPASPAGRNRVPIVTSRCAMPSPTNSAVGAVSSENPARNGQRDEQRHQHVVERHVRRPRELLHQARRAVGGGGDRDDHDARRDRDRRRGAAVEAEEEGRGDQKDAHGVLDQAVDEQRDGSVAHHAGVYTRVRHGWIIRVFPQRAGRMRCGP